VDCLTLTGVCGQIGAAPLGTECAIDMNNILFGRTLRGIVEGDSIPDIFIPRIVELFKQGRFPLDKLVTYYDFENINDAIRDAENGTVLKAVLRF
jgi:aryl-alcohol dehydrogenase